MSGVGRALWGEMLKARRSRMRLLTALAFATSVACAVIFRISASVTNGLLAKPQTPLWMTRTPKPALSSCPPAPNPKLSVTILSRTATLSFTLRVKRTSA